MSDLSKAQKHLLKQVDDVMKKVEKCIPEDWTPKQVAAFFNLYMSFYE